MSFFSLMLAGCLSMNTLAAQSTPELPPVDEAPTLTAKELDEKIFEKVEIEASVKVQDWRSHLEKNLLEYIERAAMRGMKPGQYTINVRFLVEKDGSISGVKAMNDPGYGLAQGAVRVVRTGPKWTPGELNGRKVRSYHTQPITFLIQEETKPSKKGGS